MDRRAIEIFRALNLNRYESIEVLLRICRRQKYLDGSRFCRESIDQTESFSMDRDCANFCREKKKEGLDRCKTVEDLPRSYRA